MEACDEFKIKRILQAGIAMAKSARALVTCAKNEGYDVSLERRKPYLSIADPVAEKHGQMRVIDESGEDYLYPRDFFVPVELPQSIRQAVLLARR